MMKFYSRFNNVSEFPLKYWYSLFILNGLDSSSRLVNNGFFTLDCLICSRHSDGNQLLAQKPQVLKNVMSRDSNEMFSLVLDQFS